MGQGLPSMPLSVFMFLISFCRDAGLNAFSPRYYKDGTKL